MKKLYLIALLGIAIALVVLFRYEYTADKQARVDRLTQRYEINCIKKSAYMSMDECFKLTPEEITLIEQQKEHQRIEEEAKKIEIQNAKVAKDLESRKKCQASLAQARLDYESERISNSNSKMLDWKKYLVNEYERMCK